MAVDLEGEIDQFNIHLLDTSLSFMSSFPAEASESSFLVLAAEKCTSTVQCWRMKHEEMRKNTTKPSRAQRGTVIQFSENERFSRMNEPRY
jgi:hypothetical protein